MSSFRWQDVCVYIISMASSREQRAAVQRQLRSEGIPHARVWPGVVLDHNEDRSHNLLRKLADLCIVPRSYSEEPVRAEMRGTIGSSVAHLSLLYHAHRHDECDWVMVLADDVRRLRTGHQARQYALAPVAARRGRFASQLVELFSEETLKGSALPAEVSLNLVLEHMKNLVLKHNKSINIGVYIYIDIY